MKRSVKKMSKKDSELRKKTKSMRKCACREKLSKKPSTIRRPKNKD